MYIFAIATDCNHVYSYVYFLQLQLIVIFKTIRVEEEPSEARTWVVSSGTENTVFSWSVWRRLPLHEVCFDYAISYYILLMYTKKMLTSCALFALFLWMTILGL